MQIVIGEKTTVTKLFVRYSFILFTRMLLLIHFFVSSLVNRIKRKGTANLSKNVLSIYELRRDRRTSTRNDLQSASNTLKTFCGTQN